MPISKETATDIALAWREIEMAEQLLKDVEKAASSSAIDREDIRDVFGRRVEGLQLGVPSGRGGHTLFNVPWRLARPIIGAHIAAQRSLIAALEEKALIELGAHPIASE
jgi:hypothetical protein